MSSIGVEPRQVAVRKFPELAPTVAAGHSRDHFQWAVTTVEQVLDFLTVTFASAMAYTLYSALHVGKQVHYSHMAVFEGAGCFAVMFIAMLGMNGAYDEGNSLLRVRETERILRVSCQAFLTVFAATFFSARLISRGTLVGSMLLVPVLLIAEKELLFTCLRHLHARGYGTRKVIVYGAGMTGRRLFSALLRSPKLGLIPVAIVDDDFNLAGREIFEYSYRRERSAKVQSGPLSESLIRSLDASMVIVAIPSLREEKLNQIASIGLSADAIVAFVPKLAASSDLTPNYLDVDGVLISSLQPLPRKGAYEFSKRAFDVACSLLLLPIMTPVWALIALLVRLDSSGPIFFRQARVGKNGVLFQIWKFRSMRADASEYDFHPSDTQDPRITRIGRWLRRTSLDETPQLLNILRGDMSLVGPRPEMPFIVETYEERHWQRLQVIPGLTGLWQLSADRAFQIHENIHYDLYYIRNRNFFMDIAILLHTALFAMKGV